MTPEPLRVTDCGPARTIYTADVLCEVRGTDTPKARASCSPNSTERPAPS